MNELSAVYWTWLILGPLVGAAVGQRKGRAGAGFFFGLLLGPIGWLIVALGPDLAPARLCSACKGKVPDGATKCMHCGSDLAAEPAPGVRDSANLRCDSCGKTYPSKHYFNDNAAGSLCITCAPQT